MIPTLGVGIKKPKLNCSFSDFLLMAVAAFGSASPHREPGRCLYASFVALLKSSDTGTPKARWSGAILLLL